MDALEELIARDQIRQLADRYAIAVDAKDPDSIAALYDEDLSNGRYGEGREGVATFFDHVLRSFHSSMHLVANHVIDFDDDDHAHGIVYCRAQHHVLDDEHDHWFDEAIAYWDTYVRRDEGWFFSSRRFRSWYHQEFGNPERGNERTRPTKPDGSPVMDQMPEAFPTYTTYWERPPRPIPGRQA